jgi:GntR family transcriptional regulator / MocR family aminotransferase
MLGIVLDRSSERNLSSQLCDQLRQLILAGKLSPEGRLPSTRELAAALGISRTLVLEAFEQLEAEGYVEGRKGAGSFVRPGTSIARPRRAGMPRSSKAAAADPRAGAIGAGPARQAGAVDFRPGVPALDLFPREAWARALAEAARSLPAERLGYGDGAGLPELREEAAAFLFRSRGLRASAEDLFITSGVSQAMGIASRFLFRSAGRGGPSRAVLENPCQPALSGLLRREGVEIEAARVDGEGIDPSRLSRAGSALAFVTPSHQYPLGPVLSAPRRAKLIQWAQETSSIVFEDDFDGDFRYGGPPLQPLRELDPERVLYAGSFSKSFSPALRLGYAVVPPSLREGWRAARELADIHSCGFAQAAMASFLASGAYERHVRKMRKVYASRRAALLEALEAAFGGSDGSVEILGAAAGLHVALRFRGGAFRGLRFDEATVSRIASAGAAVYPASRFAHAAFPGIERILLMGFGNLGEEAIARGVGALRRGLAAAVGAIGDAPRGH